MKVLVLQSYRTQQVSPWIDACMSSVRQWADRQSYGYEFLDDALFDYVPADVRNRCAGHKLPMTDYARLALLKQKLSGSCDRAIWIDADILVFDQERFSVKPLDGYAFCRETWLAAKADGTTHVVQGVNNAVVVMEKNNPVLDFYLHVARRRLLSCSPEEMQHTVIGTDLLSAWARLAPLSCLENVGLFSPPLVRELATTPGRLCRLYRGAHGCDVHAGNFCGSLVGKPILDVVLSDSDVAAAVDSLSRSGGAAINATDRAVC